MSYNRDQADTYESDCEHVLPPEEANIWLREIRRRTSGTPPNVRLLDIGAGAGLLMAALKEGGLNVTGLEPSAAMIEVGLANHPMLERGDFVIGNAGDCGLFAPRSCDGIVTRQMICHLVEPQVAFTCWYNWLEPGGYAVIVDGFWPRPSWSDAQLVNQPFAALTDAGPVAEMLTQVGFQVVRAGPFIELDEARSLRCPGSRPRYVVVAVKP